MEKQIAFAFSFSLALLTASFRPYVSYVLRADDSRATPVGSRDYNRQHDDPLEAPATLPLKTDQQSQINEDREESNENYMANRDLAFDRLPSDRKYQSVGFDHDGVPEAIGRSDEKYLQQNVDQDVGLAAWRKLGGDDQSDQSDRQNSMNRKRETVESKSERNSQQSTVDEDGDDFRDQTDCDVSNRHRVTSKLQQQRQPSQKRRYAEDRARQTARNKSRPSWTFESLDFDDLRGRRR